MRGFGVWSRIALIALAAAGAPVARAAAQRFGNNFQAPPPDIENLPYNGQFTFARLSYVTETSPAYGYYYRGLPAWAHGYPEAEHHLLEIMDALSTVKPRLEHSKVIAMDDPDLFKYPVAYMTEAGYWVLGDKEIAPLRKYTAKGGLIIIDDFREDDRRGNSGWENFNANFVRIFPNARLIPMEMSHPIFHSFYEISSLDIIPQAYDQGRPQIYGVFEDNDPAKRLMMLINFNTDISDFWEFSGTGRYAITESNQGYKLGVNYLIYALSH